MPSALTPVPAENVVGSARKVACTIAGKDLHHAVDAIGCSDVKVSIAIKIGDRHILELGISQRTAAGVGHSGLQSSIWVGEKNSHTGGRRICYVSVAYDKIRNPVAVKVTARNPDGIGKIEHRNRVVDSGAEARRRGTETLQIDKAEFRVLENHVGVAIAVEIRYHGRSQSRVDVGSIHQSHNRVRERTARPYRRPEEP